MAPLLDWRVEDVAAREAAWGQNLAAVRLSGREAVDALALCVHGLSCEATRFRSKSISRGSALQALLQDYRRPVLLVWGEADVTAEPMEAAESLAQGRAERDWTIVPRAGHWVQYECAPEVNLLMADRKSTRLNSSHQIISYAVFCLKKKKNDTARNEHAATSSRLPSPSPRAAPAGLS